MSLSRKIADALDENVGSPSRQIAVEEGPDRFEMTVHHASPVGVSCDGFTFTAGDRPEQSVDGLRGWGDRFAKKATYLLEPLAFHEADAPRGEVVLRSTSPTVKPDRRQYYEARLGKDGSFRFGRFAYDEAAKSARPCPCTFTHEVVERLADDLAATAP